MISSLTVSARRLRHVRSLSGKAGKADAYDASLPWGLTSRFRRRLPVSSFPELPTLTTSGLLNRPPWQRNDELCNARAFANGMRTPRDKYIFELVADATMLGEGGGSGPDKDSGAPPTSSVSSSSADAAAPKASYRVESPIDGTVTRRGRKKSIVSGVLHRTGMGGGRGEPPAKEGASSTDGNESVGPAAGDGAPGQPRHTRESVSLFLDGAKDIFTTLFKHGPALGGGAPGEARAALHSSLADALSRVPPPHAEASITIREVVHARVVDTSSVWDGASRPGWEEGGSGASEGEEGGPSVVARERGHSIAVITAPESMSLLERMVAGVMHFHQLQPPARVGCRATVAFLCVEERGGVRVGERVSPEQPDSEELFTVHTLTFEAAVVDANAVGPLAPALQMFPTLRYLLRPSLAPRIGWTVVDVDGHFAPAGCDEGGLAGRLGVALPQHGLTLTDLIPAASRAAARHSAASIEGQLSALRELGPLYDAAGAEAEALHRAVRATMAALREGGPACDSLLRDSSFSQGARSLGEYMGSGGNLVRELGRVCALLARAPSHPPWADRVDQEREWEKAVDEGGMWRVPRSAKEATEPPPPEPAAETKVNAAAAGDGSDSYSTKSEGGAGPPAAGAASVGDKEEGVETATQATQANAADGSKPTANASDSDSDSDSESDGSGDTDDLASVPARSVVPHFDTREATRATVSAVTSSMGPHVAFADSLALRVYAGARMRMERSVGELPARQLDQDMCWKIGRNMLSYSVRHLGSGLGAYAQGTAFAGRLEALVADAREAESLADDVPSPPQVPLAGGLFGDDAKATESESDDEDDGGASKPLGHPAVVSHRPLQRRELHRGHMSAGAHAYHTALRRYYDRAHGVLETLQALVADMRDAGLLLREVKLPQQAAPPTDSSGQGPVKTPSDGSDDAADHGPEEASPARSRRRARLASRSTGGSGSRPGPGPGSGAGPGAGSV